MDISILCASVNSVYGINQVIHEHNKLPKKYYNPDPVDEFDIENDKNLFFIAKNKTEITGYLWIYAGDTVKDKATKAKIIIVVHPKYRRRNIACKLFSEVVSYIKQNTKIRELFAEIKKGNESSENLINKKLNFGFVCCDSQGSSWIYTNF